MRKPLTVKTLIDRRNKRREEVVKKFNLPRLEVGRVGKSKPIATVLSVRRIGDQIFVKVAPTSRKNEMILRGVRQQRLSQEERRIVFLARRLRCQTHEVFLFEFTLAYTIADFQFWVGEVAKPFRKKIKSIKKFFNF